MLNLEAEFLTSDDLTMLERVLATTTPHESEPKEREGRAAALVRLFQSGIKQENELVLKMTSHA